MITLEPVWTAAVQQRLYRALLHATAYAGTMLDLAPHLAGAPARLGVLAALLDDGTTACDLAGLLDARERDLLGARFVACAEAAFVLADGRLPPTTDCTPGTGTLIAPETGATVVLDCADLRTGPLALELSGPGLAAPRRLRLACHPGWFAARTRWNDAPLGIDLLLVDASRLIAIPRSTAVTLLET